MAESFSYDQLIASGEGRLFTPDSGRLPLPPMLMFDRITHIDEDGGAHGLGKITAELDVRPDLWFFQCHFQGDPVMPGCLGWTPCGNSSVSTSPGCACPAKAVLWARVRSSSREKWALT